MRGIGRSDRTGAETGTRNLSRRALFGKARHGRWFRLRIPIGIGHGMRMGLRLAGSREVSRLRRFFLQAVFLQTNLTIAAIAACGALFAKMIGARILGALHADAGGLFFADTADKWHGGSHKGRDGYCGRRFVFDASAAGCRERVARQRWASRSTTAYCWSLALASSRTYSSRRSSAD